MHYALTEIRYNFEYWLIFPRRITGVTSSYPGWIKSPHVVTLGILKILDLNSLTIFGCGGGGISE